MIGAGSGIRTLITIFGSMAPCFLLLKQPWCQSGATVSPGRVRKHLRCALPRGASIGISPEPSHHQSIHEDSLPEREVPGGPFDDEAELLV
jgi:hypothetical protein